MKEAKFASLHCRFWQVLHVGNTLWSTARTEGASWLDETRNAKSWPAFSVKPQHNLKVRELIEFFFHRAMSKCLGCETLMQGREKICNRMIHKNLAVWGHLSAGECRGVRMVFEGLLVHGEVQQTWFSLVEVSAMTTTSLRLIYKNDSYFCTVQQAKTNTEPLLNKQVFVLRGVWLWAGGMDKDERPGGQVKESKKVVRVLWGLYLLYPFVPGILGIMISHYRIPIDQPVQCDVQVFCGSK